MPINWMRPFSICVPKSALSLEPLFTADMIAALNSRIGTDGMLPRAIGSPLWKDGKTLVMPDLAKQVRGLLECAS